MKNINKYTKFCLILLISLSFISQKSIASNTLKKVKYNYLISVPEDYDKDPNKKWPIIFYLHGRHASGTNLQSLKRYGLPYYIMKGKRMDFIVVSPQCPWNKNWSSEDWFNPVYDEVAAKLRVDDSRIYLIGMSMGGFGTWSLANRMPDRFAAIAPMCGAADTKWVGKLKDIPTWIFHGTADRQIPFSRSEVMYKALVNVNPNLKFSRLEKQGHDISKQFNNDDLYTWLKQFAKPRVPFWEEPLPFMKPIIAKNVSVSSPKKQTLQYAILQGE